MRFAHPAGGFCRIGDEVSYTIIQKSCTRHDVQDFCFIGNLQVIYNSEMTMLTIPKGNSAGKIYM